MIQSIAGVLPLTPSVQAELDVDERVIWQIEQGGSEVLAELFRPLYRALCAVAETLAEDISEDCVFIRHAGAGSSPFTQAYVARWMPGPSAPVEFRGGHIDGEHARMARDEDGWPPLQWRVPGPPTPVIDFRDETEPVGPVFDHSTYRLVGFRNNPAVWVYDLA